ncbi:MAG: 2-oxoglutarate dehydrogenase complex dihydrolipoyllysine-residue succinyltransferase [Pseudomonadota bacterium]
MTEVRVPTLGESVTEATVATWLKKPGEQVAADELLVELETDKVTVEVNAPVAGTLEEIVAQDGDIVGVDALLANIAEGAAAEAPSSKPEPLKLEANAQTGGGDPITIDVPALGESVAEATVGTWLKTPGDAVAADEVLVELETDKVSVEVSAPSAGTLSEILVQDGATVEAGGILAKMIPGDAAAAAAQPTPTTTASMTSAPNGVQNAPSAEKMMANHGVAASSVNGTGRDGRIMKEDVQRAITSPTPAPTVTTSAPTPLTARAPSPADDAAREERVKMTRLRATIARRLKDAQNTAAMLTTYNEVDMSAVMALRNEYKDLFLKKHGVKLGFMSFFTKACCHALMEVPEVNAEIDGDEIVYKNFVHMGVAVGTPTGLVVPVVRDADKMGFSSIEKGIAEMGAKARDGKLSMSDMQGGTFTISNGGVYGSLMSSPILNPPQSGILGMHKIQERPMVVNGEIVVRPMMYLALSYDHRIVDGKGAVTFLVRVKEALEDPRRLLMDL